MAQKRRRGYKPPSNYEPSRGKKPRRGPGRPGASGGEQRGSTGDPRRRGDGDRQPRVQRDELQRGRGNGDAARPRGPAAGRAGGRKRDLENEGSGRRKESPEQQRRAGHRERRASPRHPNPSRESGYGSGSRAHGGGARIFAFDLDGRARAPKGGDLASQEGSRDGAAGRHGGARTAGAQAKGGKPGASTAARPPEEYEGVDTFAALGLGGNIVRTLTELGAEQPFPIQAATIPDALAGRDVLGRGRTGSGKTIAFGAPLVERLLQLRGAGAFDDDAPRERRKQQRGVRGERTRRTVAPARKPKAVILAPTRELALQIDRTVQPIARSVGLYTVQLVGGVPLDPQLHALERGTDIVIGTPGRIQDLVTRRKLDLRQVVISVVDEADHMCDLGFLESVQRILRYTAREGQRLLFSATLDDDVQALVDEFLHEPAAHDVTAGDMPVSKHRVFLVLREDKQRAVIGMLQQPGRIIAFCRTRAYAEMVTEFVREAGVRAVPLHGDLKQAMRERNLAKFAEGKADVLVATDVAARGIHVDAVDMVVQLDPPDDPKTYLHRAGRTGRAGGTGEVVTLIPPTRQKRTRELFEALGLEPDFFGDYL